MRQIYWICMRHIIVCVCLEIEAKEKLCVNACCTSIYSYQNDRQHSIIDCSYLLYNLQQSYENTSVPICQLYCGFIRSIYSVWQPASCQRRFHNDPQYCENLVLLLVKLGCNIFTYLVSYEEYTSRCHPKSKFQLCRHVCKTLLFAFLGCGIIIYLAMLQKNAIIFNCINNKAIHFRSFSVTNV